MLIGVAPPHVKDITTKTVPNSAANDEDDNLRKQFVVPTLGCSWDDLLERGLFLVHGVKCGIVPKDRHQEPPDDVVDVCAPLHLADELRLTRPPRIVAFGGAPHRALAKVPEVTLPKGLVVSRRVGELVAKTRGGVEVRARGWTSRLHVSPFPLNGKKPNPMAAEILREAARLSELIA
jgi:uracil-DNA glycosylase